MQARRKMRKDVGRVVRVCRPILREVVRFGVGDGLWARCGDLAQRGSVDEVILVELGVCLCPCMPALACARL